MIRAAESNLAKVTDKTIVIPGHGKIAGKAGADRIPRHAGNDLRPRCRAEEGRQIVDEIIAAKPTAAYDSKWAGSFINGDVFTKLVYDGA